MLSVRGLLYSLGYYRMTEQKALRYAAAAQCVAMATLIPQSENYTQGVRDAYVVQG